jgi:hypothetical protein
MHDIKYFFSIKIIRQSRGEKNLGGQKKFQGRQKKFQGGQITEK